MIVKELHRTRKDGTELYRTFSDEGKKIRKVNTDEVYDEAVDLAGVNFEYIETEEAAEL